MRERRVLLPERLHVAADVPHGHTEMVELALEVAPLRLGARGRGDSAQLPLDVCGSSLGVERVHLPHVTQPNPVHVGSPTPRIICEAKRSDSLAQAPTALTWAMGAGLVKGTAMSSPPVPTNSVPSSAESFAEVSSTTASPNSSVSEWISSVSVFITLTMPRTESTM